MRQVLDGWQLAPILTARTGNPFTVFDTSGFVGGDTIFARYIPTAAIQTSGTSDGTSLGPNVFQYLALPDPNTYHEPLTGSGELPTCDLTTNALGDTWSPPARTATGLPT